MILSDISIREALGAGRIVIDPLDESCIQPSSIDVKISNLFRVFRNHTAPVIDVKKDLTDLTELIEVPLDGVFMLHPGEFVLGSTLERVAIADDLVARVEGKSSLGRLGSVNKKIKKNYYQGALSSSVVPNAFKFECFNQQSRLYQV